MSDQLNTISNRESVGYQYSDNVQKQDSVPVKYEGRDSRLQTNPLSLIADAQEEIGFMRAGSGDLKLKDEHKPGVIHSNRNTIVALAAKYLDAQASSDVLEAGTPDMMLKRLKQSVEKNSTERDAQKTLDKILKDFQCHANHEKFAALIQLQAAIVGDTAELDHVNRIVSIGLSNLSVEDGSSISAGFNMHNRIKSSKGLGRSADVVDTYQNVIAVQKGIADIYKKIKEAYGIDKLKVSLEFLVGAAGDDIGSIGPSASRIEIQSSINSMKKLQTIASIQSECMESTSKINIWIKPNLKDYAMLESVLEIVDNQWPLATDVHEMCPRIVVDKPQANVAFLHQLSSLSSMIPLEAFEDEGVRENLIDVVRQARNESVEVEEAESYEST